MIMLMMVRRCRLLIRPRRPGTLPYISPALAVRCVGFPKVSYRTVHPCRVHMSIVIPIPMQDPSPGVFESTSTKICPRLPPRYHSQCQIHNKTRITSTCHDVIDRARPIDILSYSSSSNLTSPGQQAVVRILPAWTYRFLSVITLKAEPVDAGCRR